MAREAKYGQVTVEHGNIPPNEPVFLMRAQDKLAVETVLHYAKLRAQNGDHKGEALCKEAANAMRAWPVKKMPD